MFWPNLIFRFFRIGPVGLFMVALAVLGLGFYVQVSMNKTDALARIAYEAGPPAAVDIVLYAPDRHKTDHDEVVLIAQPVLDFAYELTIEQDGPDKHVFMVPLVAPTATSEKAIVGIAYYPTDYDFSDITPALLASGVQGFGPIGPVVHYNGEIDGMGRWDDLTKEAFFDEGLTLPFAPVIVWPYMEGRAAAFAPTQIGGVSIITAFSYLAAAIAGLGMLKLVFGGQGKDPTPAQMQNAPQTTATFDPIPAKGLLDRPIPDQITPDPVNDVPLWKQRSGLADAAQTATPQRPVDLGVQGFRSAATTAPVLPQKRAGFGFRKVLIVIVGGLFLLGLVAVVGDLISKSGSASTVSVSSKEDIAAVVIVDAIVPDADPNRHWTDIDLKPAVEWFTAQALKAIGGDTNAQITLGMIFGGVFALMVGLRWFFLIRSTLGPTRRVHSFDDLTTG